MSAGMKVWIERVGPGFLDVFDVAIAMQAGNVTQYVAGLQEGALGRPAEIEWKTVRSGDVIPIFARVPKEVLSALAEALGEFTQAGDQTLEALADARQLRDRLLSMVESEWQSRQLERS